MSLVEKEKQVPKIQEPQDQGRVFFVVVVPELF